MDQQPQKGCRLIHLLMVASLLSLVLQIVGYASTGWYRMEIQMVSIDIGLYQVGVCVYSVCVRYGYAGLKNIDNAMSNTNQAIYETFIDWVTKYRVMASLALVADIIVTFIILMYLIQSRSRRFPASFKCQLGTVIFMGLASGGLAIACAAKVGAEIIDDKNLVELVAINIVEFPFPYSLLILGLGGVVSALVSVATMLLLISELKAHKVMTTTPPALGMQHTGFQATEMQQTGAVCYISPVNYSTGQAPHQQMQNIAGYIPPPNYYTGLYPNAEAPSAPFKEHQQMQNIAGYIPPPNYYTGLYPNAEAPSAPFKEHPKV